MSDPSQDLALKSRLPPGWTTEQLTSAQVAIAAPHGAVTIDIDGRYFKLGRGIGLPRPYSMACKYTGRGWVGRLVGDQDPTVTREDYGSEIGVFIDGTDGRQAMRSNP